MGAAQDVRAADQAAGPRTASQSRRATDLLGHGEPVGIFPEGTRQVPGASGDEPSEAHAGVAFIAMRAGVPVVPVGIAGTDRALPKGARFPRFPGSRSVMASPCGPRSSPKAVERSAHKL